MRPMQLSEAPSKQLQITVRRVDTVADLRASIAAELGAAVMSCNYYATTAVSEAKLVHAGSRNRALAVLWKSAAFRLQLHPPRSWIERGAVHRIADE